MKKILIVDDNYENLQKIFNNINANLNENIKIDKICNDGKLALEYILKEKFDIIILELDMPTLNGIQILKEMKSKNIKSNVIITSKNSKLIFELINKKLDYSKILVKPFKTDTLLKILNFISNISLKNTKYEQITNLLNYFNFNINTTGYYYIIGCLLFCIKNNYTFITQIKNLYKEIELKSNKKVSSSQIEWNVSKAIQTMNKCTDKDILYKYFPYTTFPSPKTFLNGILMLYYSKYDISNINCFDKERILNKQLLL